MFFRHSYSQKFMQELFKLLNKCLKFLYQIIKFTLSASFENITLASEYNFKKLFTWVQCILTSCTLEKSAFSTDDKKRVTFGNVFVIFEFDFKMLKLPNNFFFAI